MYHQYPTDINRERKTHTNTHTHTHTHTDRSLRFQVKKLKYIILISQTHKQILQI